MTARVYRSGDDAPDTGRRVLRPADPDEMRVRALLIALRPDAADPCARPPDEHVPSTPVHIADPSAAWGGIPAGVELFETPEPVRPPRTLADVTRELAALPPDARAVLRWVQLHGHLDAGPRGLFCDVGIAFQSEAQAEAWRDLGARREGAYLLGRHLVWSAAKAWGR